MFRKNASEIMKKTIISLSVSICLGLLPLLTASAQKSGDISAEGVRVSKDGSLVKVSMDIDLSRMSVKSSRAVLLTPWLVNGGDSLELPSVGVYGRQRYYYYLRRGKGMISGKDELTLRSKKLPSDVVPYSTKTDYLPWMSGCSLVIVAKRYGCCEKVEDLVSAPLVEDAMYIPPFHYICPPAEMKKDRHLDGMAYIAFHLDKTNIDPELENNTAELGKIRATIDSISTDNEVTVNKLWMKGYASPEGNYTHNEELARERMNTIRSHVQLLSHIDPSIITTEYEAEDWDGFIEWLREESELRETEAILAIAENGKLSPDDKEKALRRQYPAQTKYIIDNVFPRLRRTEYSISYIIKAFTDPQMILEKLKTEPQKLSLNEFYLAAAALESGSEAFKEVFDVAVAMYPSNEVANLNAANAAMERGNLASAEKYLAKAGESAQAEYARGIFAVLSNDYGTAVDKFRHAEAEGVPDAGEAVRIYTKY